MPNKSISVVDFIENLKHPNQHLIYRLREVILSLDNHIVESIKWNAPNFTYKGEDRFTFNFPPKKSMVRLILHFGARMKLDAKNRFVDNPTKCFTWLSTDRAMLTFHEIDDLEGSRNEVELILSKWLTLS